MTLTRHENGAGAGASRYTDMRGRRRGGAQLYAGGRAMRIAPPQSYRVDCVRHMRS